MGISYNPPGSGFNPAIPGPIGGTTAGLGTFAGVKIVTSGSNTNYYSLTRNGTDGRLEIVGNQGTFNGVRLLTQGGTVKLEFDGTNGYLGVGSANTVINSVQCALGVTGNMWATGNGGVQGTWDVGGNFSTFGSHNILGGDFKAGTTGGTGETLFFTGGGELYVGNTTASINPAFYPGGAQIYARGDGGNAKMRICTVGDAGIQGYLAFDRTRGTYAAPTALQSGDILGGIVGVGHNGDAATLKHGAQINILTTEVWDATHLGCALEFYTVTTGATAQTLTLRLKDGNASFPGSVTAGSFVGVSLAPTAVKTGSYTLAAGDFVPADTTAGAVALTLPTAPADGTRVAAKMVIQGATNTVTLTAGGSDVFNKTGGGTTYTISLVNQGATFQYKASGAIWYVVNDNLSLAQLDLRFSPLAGGTSFITAGTITTGTWNAGVIAGQYGGTGVANTGKTITLAGNLITTGAFNTTFAQAASITVTLPGTSATMARTDAGQIFTGIQAITYSDNGGLGGFSLTNSNSGNNAYSEIDITNNSSTHSLSFGLGGTGVAVNGGCFDGNFCYILGNGGTDGLNIGAGKAAGVVNFYSGGSTVTQRRMRLHASGGLSLGSITDPGATNFSVAGTIGVTGVSTLIGGANVPTLTASRVVLTDAGKNLVSGNGPAAQVVASGDFLAQTATKASVASYTTPNDATVHSFRVGGYANVTAISAGTLTMTVTFTDENNASQTITYFGMGLTSAGITTTGFTGFSSSYIRCKANTAITFVATFVGVSITYDVGASIESLY